jgi:hypothetical protein
MDDTNICLEHKMCMQMIQRNEDDIQILWKEINNMKKLAITTMIAVIIQMFVFVGNIVYNAKSHNSNNNEQVSSNTTERNM